MPPPSPSTREYLSAVDWIKATAIVAVVLTHALDVDTAGTSPSPMHTWLHFLMHFCVPAFLLASGVLYAQGGRSGSRAFGRRLARIAVPYAIASVVAQLSGLSEAHGPTDVIFEFATGASLTIYYYVFLLIVCLLLTWALELLHPRAIDVALVGLCVHAIVTTLRPVPPESFFWTIRNPLHFYGYFLVGLLAWRHRAWLDRYATRYPVAVGAVCVTGIAVFVGAGPVGLARPSAGISRALYTLGVVGLIALVGSRHPPPAAVRFLSRASYTVYLYHLFFVYVASTPTAALGPALRIVLRLAVGLAGPIVVCLAGVRVLGTRARLVLGT